VQYWVVRRFWLALSIAAIASAQAPISPAQWDEAGRQVLRLPPNAFTQLPAKIIADLNRRGCTIPQAFEGIRLEKSGPHNVIKGEFAKPRQTDWAVLCSVNRVSSILIFWSGSVADVSEIEQREDIHYLEGTWDNRIVYTRLITPVGAQFIKERAAGNGGPEPPPLDHQGINDAMLEKASMVQYFYNGGWMRLSGDD
jgi:hypothetical protein